MYPESPKVTTQVSLSLVLLYHLKDHVIPELLPNLFLLACV